MNKNEFLYLYREYIEDFDDSYEAVVETDQQLEHELEVECFLLGCDISTKILSDTDVERLNRYKDGLIF